jgi:excisionase family DNA binding protein
MPLAPAPTRRGSSPYAERRTPAGGSASPVVLPVAEARGEEHDAIIADGAHPGIGHDVELEIGFRNALDREQLSLLFQPVLDLSDGRIAELETSVHWDHSTLSAERLGASLESSALMGQFQSWVLGAVCRQLRSWHAAGAEVPLVSIGVSALWLEQPGSFGELRRAVDESHVAPEALVFAVTGNFPGNQGGLPVSVIRELHSLGYRTTLEDFGGAYSSLSELEHLPLYGVKIDGSLVAQLAHGIRAPAVLDAVLSLARALGLRVTAEGVESQHQADALLAAGCHQATGPLFAGPLTPNRIPAMLEGAPGLVDLTQDILHFGAAARTLEVSASTLRRWIDSGRITAVRTSGGHRRLSRSEVEREQRRLNPGPVIRVARLPEDALPHIGAVILQRGAWLRDVVLQSIYVGDDSGWFGTPGGTGELDRWLRVMGEGLSSGDFARVTTATTALLGAARLGGVPLSERISLLDGVGQGARAAVEAGHGGAGEWRDWLRVGRAFNQLAVQDADAGV